MIGHPLPRLLTVTRDAMWYQRVRQAVAGQARTRKVGSLAQLDRAPEAAAILIDGAAVPDIDRLVHWLRSQAVVAPVAVAAAVPEWRDAVTLMTAGAFDYFAKTYDVIELSRRLQTLLQISSDPSQVERDNGQEAQAYSVC